MPNMVDNMVIICGPYKRLAELEIAAMEHELLQTIKPLSKSSLETAVKTWGTKWDVQDTSPTLHHDGGEYDEDRWSLELQFESPWMPPIGAYEILLDDGLTVAAHFMDTSGQDYGGSFIDGELKTYPLDKLPENISRMFQNYDYDRLNQVA